MCVTMSDLHRPHHPHTATATATAIHRVSPPKNKVKRHAPVRPPPYLCERLQLVHLVKSPALDLRRCGELGVSCRRERKRAY